MSDAAAAMRTLLVERVMPHPIEEWLMQNDFRPVVGHRFNLRSKPMPHWNGVVDCEVLVVEPNERLSYSWNASGEEAATGDKDHRYLDADARERRRACAHGADGLPAGGHGQLPGRKLRLAEVFCRSRSCGGGAGMKTFLVSRYHPLLVTLHWLLAILIVAMLCAGFLLLAAMPNTDPQKIGILLIHMSLGMFILALMVVRFIVRMWTARPAAPTTGHSMLDRIAPSTHYGFYILVFLMAASGLATAILAGLDRSVFQGSGEPLPPSFAVYPTFVAHGYLALLLAGLVILHVLAALYHQFARKDRLFPRMWFGGGASGLSAPAK
jgi:cytochrome b561/uncharacterized protein YndB with AHSA1/START domain